MNIVRLVAYVIAICFFLRKYYLNKKPGDLYLAIFLFPAILREVLIETCSYGNTIFIVLEILITLIYAFILLKK